MGVSMFYGVECNLDLFFLFFFLYFDRNFLILDRSLYKELDIVSRRWRIDFVLRQKFFILHKHPQSGYRYVDIEMI